MSGTLYITATPIGNLEDITLRALRVLKEVKLIAAEDTRRTRKLLTHFEIHTPLTSFFIGNEKGKSDAIISEVLSGKDVALVTSAGTPCISDPGYSLLASAIKAGVNVVPVPGASALSCALSACGLPTDRFLFTGFLPDKPGKRRNTLEELKNFPFTLVFYISPWKAADCVSDCLQIFGDRQACVCRELTKIHEEFIRAPLSEILARFKNEPPKGEMTLVVSSRNSA